MQISRDASLFAHQLDVVNDRVLLVTLSEQDYREASFLDQRLLTPERTMQWADWAALVDESMDLRGDAQFIFHIGHVGSTLISRLLGEIDTVFALREPQLLRNFAELGAQRGTPESFWPPERFSPRLQTAIKWLSRTPSESKRALIKATSFVSEIAGDILTQDRKALFLKLSPQRYIETILAGDNSRQELAMLSGARLTRLHKRLGGKFWNLWELPEATRAVLGWVCEMTALEQAASAAPPENIMWLDFDDFLVSPAENLKQTANFFGHNIDETKAVGITNSPIMQSYSKAPEHAYSTDLREQVMRQAREQHGEAIVRAMQWLEEAANEHEIIAQALARETEE